MDAFARDAFDDNAQHIRCQLFTVVVELGNAVWGVCLRGCLFVVCSCFGMDLNSRAGNLGVFVRYSLMYE